MRGGGTGGGRYYNMSFSYPPDTPVDLKGQMEAVELTERCNRRR
jgi:hypothetical protein